MSARGVEDVNMYEGSINGDIFCDLIERCLIPILQPFNGTNDSSIIVMDNTSIHHVDRVVTTIQNTGALLRFLPPCSPDFNPTEELFSKMKAILKVNELSYDVATSLSLLIIMGFRTVRTEDCIGNITHAEYNTQVHVHCQ